MSGVHAATPPVADPGEQAARDDDNQPRGYWIGGCGHRRPLWVNGRVDECQFCGPCRPP